MVTVAAALLMAATLAGCGPTSPPLESVSPPSPPAPEPIAVVSPPPVRSLPPLSPPIEVPMPPVPTVRGPSAPHDPAASATPTPQPAPSPQPSPTASPAPTPGPTGLTALLPLVAALPPLTWVDADGERTAPWTELAAAAAVPPIAAITHVAAARGSAGDCAAVAHTIDGAALEAAAVSLAADPAPGAPFDLVLLRYDSPAAAGAALAALQALGAACEGIETADGVLGAGAAGGVVLRSVDTVLVVEATVVDALLVAVQHEGAPPEAVAALLAAVR